MSRPILTTVITLGALLLVLLVWLSGGFEVAWVDRPADVVSPPRVQGKSQLASDGADRAATTGAEPPLEIALDAPESARASLGERPALDVVPPVRTVRGQVVDEFGAGVAGTWVALDVAAGARGDAPPIWSSITPPILSAPTDATGWFEFTESDASLGGVLFYGLDQFVGATSTAPVDPTGRDHLLQFPTRGANAPALVVELTDAASGEPLMPDLVELRLVAWPQTPVDDTLPESITSRGAYRKAPLPQSIVRRFGQVRVERLAPGTWELVLRSSRSAFYSARVEMPLMGDDVVLAAAVATYDTNWLLGATLEPDAATDPDGTNGFDQHGLPAPSRALGERSSNAHFRHTIRGFGSGHVSGAVLELELEGVPDNCGNDTLSLEFTAGGFAWGAPISLLAGSAWKVGRRIHLVLDLAALPRPGGAVSLLEHLADGALDVCIQDDTAVHSLVLHVRP